jgi:hypothetical protein
MAKKIEFPALNAEGEVKLKRLLTTIGEYMGDEIKTENMIVLVASVPDDREDMRTVFKRIADGIRKPPRSAKKPVSPPPPPPSKPE